MGKRQLREKGGNAGRSRRPRGRGFTEYTALPGARYLNSLGGFSLGSTFMAVKVPPVGAPTHMALRLLGPQGQVLDQASAFVQPGDAQQQLTVDIAKGQKFAKAGLQLEISGMTGSPVRIPVATR